MTLGEVFLESLSTGVITEQEIDWLAAQQNRFNRDEEATALKLGRLLDSASSILVAEFLRNSSGTNLF